MSIFLYAARAYAVKIEEYLKDNEWLLDSAFQQALINDAKILDLCEFTQVQFPLGRELGSIDSYGRINQASGKAVVQYLIKQPEDSYVILGVLLYMYITLRSCWNKDNEPALLQLQLYMHMLAKPEPLDAPITSMSAL